MKFYVYELIDPRNNKTFYVGKGSGNRVNKHELSIKKYNKDITNNIEKYNIINSILNDGMNTKIKIVYESVNELDCYKKEENLIQEYGLSNLTNIHSSKNVTKISELVKKGLKKSYKNKARLDYIKTDEYRNKCRENNTGDKNPFYGKKWNELQRKNIILANKKEKTEEHKNKIRESLKQYEKTKEHKSNISNALKNSTKFKEAVTSDEYKAKQSRLSSGSSNGNAKKFIFKAPSGEIYEVKGGYYKFLKEHNLSVHGMKKVRSGIIETYKGWSVKEL